MIKNNFTTPATYVSPAVKVTKLNPRRVMCQSPFDSNHHTENFMLDEDEAEF